MRNIADRVEVEEIGIRRKRFEQNVMATFGLVVLLLTTVALLACCLPALRATRVDPITTLRYE